MGYVLHSMKKAASAEAALIRMSAPEWRQSVPPLPSPQADKNPTVMMMMPAMHPPAGTAMMVTPVNLDDVVAHGSIGGRRDRSRGERLCRHTRAKQQTARKQQG